jgi:hypothetical protein
MLPMYIIEELERDKIKEPKEQVYIECPDLDDPHWHQIKRPNTEKTDERRRGVVIVDYTI